MLINIRDEFCSSYAKNTSIIGVFMKMFGDHINFNKPCPWLPGDYYIKEFNFALKDWPNFIPEGRYILNTTLFTQPDVASANFKIYFEVKNYGILDMRVG